MNNKQIEPATKAVAALVTNAKRTNSALRQIITNAESRFASLLVLAGMKPSRFLNASFATVQSNS